MKNSSKDKELGDSPGFFVGCPEQEFHLEMHEKEAQKIEDVC